MQENVIAKLDVYKQCQHKFLLRKYMYEPVMLNPSYLMSFDQETENVNTYSQQNYDTRTYEYMGQRKTETFLPSARIEKPYYCQLLNFN